MPASARGLGQTQNEAGAHLPVGGDPRFGEDLESERVEGVAGEDRGPLVVGLVQRRLAAPQVVVVHGGEVVVHQRVAMHALDCGGDVEGDGGRNIEQRRAFEDEEGTEPLASAEDGLAHGAPQPRRHGGAGASRISASRASVCRAQSASLCAKLMIGLPR